MNYREAWGQPCRCGGYDQNLSVLLFIFPFGSVGNFQLIGWSNVEIMISFKLSFFFINVTQCSILNSVAIWLTSAKKKKNSFAPHWIHAKKSMECTNIRMFITRLIVDGTNIQRLKKRKLALYKCNVYHSNSKKGEQTILICG